ncbi:MAG: transcription elongation factor subunit Spt4 [Nanoarchaeota archaeon]
MAKEKVCKYCKLIHEQEVCPNCGKKETLNTFKGKVEIINQEKSEISKRLKINKNGVYAIRI